MLFDDRPVDGVFLEDLEDLATEGEDLVGVGGKE